MLFLFNMAIIMSVNSRLSFMIFFLFVVLFLTKGIKAAKGLYTISLLTMPLMMSFALLIYEILSLPFFVAISLPRGQEGRDHVQRPHLHLGKRLRMGDARRSGIEYFGNGYNGQYRLRMLEHVAKMWEAQKSYNLHMHSASLGVSFVDQGIDGVCHVHDLLASVQRLPVGISATYRHGTALRRGVLPDVRLADRSSGYSYYIGWLLLFALMAPLCIKPSAVTGKRKALDGSWLN